MLNTTGIESETLKDVQEQEQAAFLKALEDPETRAKVIRLLEEAELLP